jgi:probable HAF family extracellular repeat protein
MNAVGHAATWDSRTGRVRDLGLLPESYWSHPAAINDHGAVAGGSCAPMEASYGCHAFVWTASRGLTDLGTFGGAFSGSAAMNDRGVVVGYAETAAHDGTATARAFVWTPRSGLRSLGVLAGMSDSAATDLNNAGTVVGFSSRIVTGPSGTTSIIRAFVWTPLQGLHDLGLPTAAIGSSSAYGMNDHGTIVGDLSDDGGMNLPYRTFIYQLTLRH